MPCPSLASAGMPITLGFRRAWVSQRQGSVVRPGLHGRTRAAAQSLNGNGAAIHEAMMRWLGDAGLPEQAVELCDETGLAHRGYPMGMTVAARDVKPGDVLLSVPLSLCITLDRVFEDSTLAELLTTEKISELASLTLYLCYEKRLREASQIAPFIRELDRQRARGQQAVPSPLLWSEDDIESLLKGSPVVGQIRERQEALRKEYDELDTVWYMASALFNRYPFDPPTEAFSFEVFRQAFCAVQASIVHLRGEGVEASQRFAIVPMGPPMLQYSSTSKAAFLFNPESNCVELRADVGYKKGNPVKAWCGPQPNAKLLINYGICNDDNPFDSMPLTVSIAQQDPLFSAKRTAVQKHGLSTRVDFKLLKNAPLPQHLLPYLRLAHAKTAEEVAAVSFEKDAKPIGESNESVAVTHLQKHLEARLKAYPTTVESDKILENDPRASPKQRVAARLVRIEKEILLGALEHVKSTGVKAHNGAFGSVTISDPGSDAAFCG